MNQSFRSQCVSADKLITQVHSSKRSTAEKNTGYSDKSSLTFFFTSWSMLQQRRQMSRLTMMYKIVNDQSCPVQIPDYVQKKTRVTRSFHPKRFISLGSKSNTYKYSFFIKTVKEWNGLPEELIEQETLESFKSALADYLNHWQFFCLFCFTFIWLVYTRTCNCTF